MNTDCANSRRFMPDFRQDDALELISLSPALTGAGRTRDARHRLFLAALAAPACGCTRRRSRAASTIRAPSSREIYAALCARRERRPRPEPRHAYSARLARACSTAYDALGSGRMTDLVGSLDFDWWMNAQDWEISRRRRSSSSTSARRPQGRRGALAQLRPRGFQPLPVRPRGRPLGTRRRRQRLRPRRRRLDAVGAAAGAAGMRRAAMRLAAVLAGLSRGDGVRPAGSVPGDAACLAA